MILHALIGLLIASALAVCARRLHALTTGGAICAALVGALIVAAGGLAWSVILLLFFLPSSALGRLRGGHPHGLVEKSSRRDAGQVIANGGVAAAAGLLYLFHPASAVGSAFAGALAAASSDTWATEVGTRFGGEPRLLAVRQRVAPGTSGAVTGAGLMASLVGAAVIAAGAGFALGPSAALPTLVGGLLGSLSDTVLGATLQNRRYCPVCDVRTEQRVHTVCGSRTRSDGGIAWLDNDGVNFAATAVGAAVAALCRLV